MHNKVSNSRRWLCILFSLIFWFSVYIAWPHRNGRCENDAFENIQGVNMMKCSSSDSIKTIKGMYM